MKMFVLKFLFKVLVVISAIFLMLILYVCFPKNIDLVITNVSDFDVAYVNVLACDTSVKFPVIKKGESKKLNFRQVAKGLTMFYFLMETGSWFLLKT
jgi:hypothetical protein